jgi:hypothetical protein
MTDQDLSIVPDCLAYPLPGLLPDLWFVEVVADLSQITQQRPFPEPSEKP